MGATSPDLETHSRLLDSASRLFAERGFSKVTVREICRDAEANVAAVSYHFRDKLGLYMAVVNGALDTIRREHDATMAVPRTAAPADKIHHYVRAYLPKIIRAAGKTELIHKLMRHEMTEPTPAARLIVEQVIVPRLDFLREAIAELIGTDVDDVRVSRSVMSLQAQCLFYAPDRFKSAAFPGWQPADDASIEAAADHITEFSLAGIRSLRSERGGRR
jgi:AcrR family transcriptional regulator